MRGTFSIYRIAMDPTLDLLCKEDVNVGRSKAESSLQNKSNDGRNCCSINVSYDYTVNELNSGDSSVIYQHQLGPFPVLRK